MIDQLAAHARVYRALAAASLRSRAQYRVSFAVDIVTVFASTAIDFVAVLVIFGHLTKLGGFSLWEVGLLYGLAGISFGLTDTVLGQLDSFDQWIRGGRFDVFMIRPVGTFFQVVAAELAVRRIGKIAQAGIVLCVALAHLPIAWSAGRVAMLPVTVICGAVIYGAVWVGWASVGFWTTDIREVTNAFTYGGNFLAGYPITIFDQWVRRFFAFVMPMAFVAYYPSLYILGRADPLGGPAWLPFLTPAVAVASTAVAASIWRTGVRRYRSTGS